MPAVPEYIIRPHAGAHCSPAAPPSHPHHHHQAHLPMGHPDQSRRPLDPPACASSPPAPVHAAGPCPSLPVCLWWLCLGALGIICGSYPAPHSVAQAQPSPLPLLSEGVPPSKRLGINLLRHLCSPGLGEAQCGRVGNCATAHARVGISQVHCAVPPQHAQPPQPTLKPWPARTPARSACASRPAWSPSCPAGPAACCVGSGPTAAPAAAWPSARNTGAAAPIQQHESCVGHGAGPVCTRGRRGGGQTCSRVGGGQGSARRRWGRQGEAPGLPSFEQAPPTQTLCSRAHGHNLKQPSSQRGAHMCAGAHPPAARC